MKLEGNRTYIIAAVLFICGGLKALGYIDESTYGIIASLLVPAGIATLRLGVKK